MEQAPTFDSADLDRAAIRRDMLQAGIPLNDLTEDEEEFVDAGYSFDA